VDAWFAASRHWGVTLAFNKGLAGAPAAALDAAKNTAMNPDVLDAFALALFGDYGPPLYTVSASDPVAAHARAARVRAAAPETGAYVNECDYFQEGWQQAFWGANYPRLLRVKGVYDPDGLFTVHHSVGSEA
jgi:hypothetical protein